MTPPRHEVARVARGARARSRRIFRRRCARSSGSCAPTAWLSASWPGTALHRRSGEADRQRVPLPGTGAAEHRGADRGRRPADPDGLPALPQDPRRRLPGVRLRGRGRAHVGLRSRARREAGARRIGGRWAAGRFSRSRHLGRYAGHHHEPRALLSRVRRRVREPVRAGGNPFCCGAGGGLLFEEHEEGTRISQRRFEQLCATGADTVVTACPFDVRRRPHPEGDDAAIAGRRPAEEAGP